MKKNRMFEWNMYKGTTPQIFENANDLRKSQTEAEEILWQELRNRKLCGVKFRRQHPLNQFVLDFYSNEKNLAIELDGDIHNVSDVKEHDENRTFELENMGIKIIRFRNEEIIFNLKNVLLEITKYL